MITKLKETGNGVVGYRLSGKLRDDDYRQFVPELDAFIDKHGKIRLLVQFADFHGWDLHALWDDLKVGARHYADISRLALVGERDWHRWTATLAKPFTQGEVRYFETAAVDEAWAWLEGA